MLTSSPSIPTLGDLLERLGGVPAERVRYFPLPGTATVADVVEIRDRERRLCELVGGVLVQKPIGFWESVLAGAIASALRAFVVPRKLGKISGEGGMMQIAPDLVLIPDVAFVSRARFSGAPALADPAPLLVPNLAVEVLSVSNTAFEMKRKRNEYFSAGVGLVWIVDPARRTVEVYTSPETPDATLNQDQTLTGGEVLPGFTLELRPLFAELDE